MKKKPSIIKLSIIGVILLLGLVLSFVPINIGLTTFKSFTGSISLGRDFNSGVVAVYEMAEGESTENFSERMDTTRNNLEELLLRKNYTEVLVVRENDTRIRVEIANIGSPTSFLETIGKPVNMRFDLDDEGVSKTIITDKQVLTATPGYDSQTGYYVVSLTLDDVGKQAFSDATASINKDKPINIIITSDGEDETLASPTVGEQITDGKIAISGISTYEQAENIAFQIKSNQFGVKLSLVGSSTTIQSVFGEHAALICLIAGMIALVLIMAVLSLIYKMLGGISSASLLLFTVMYLFFIAFVPGIELSLSGIIGILVSFILLIDSNIITIRRIREEFRNGKSIVASYYSGFKRSLWTVFDTHVIALIASLVFMFGLGALKSFGFMLLIGTLLSAFTALLINRGLIKYVLAINPSNEKLYGLKRGKGFENVSSTETDSSISASEVITANPVVKEEGGLANEIN